MDIKEIERLHAQYAAPPVTIEMDTSGKARLDAAASPAASQLRPDRNGAIVARIKPIHLQCLGILAIAVLAFGGGRWLASSDARKPSEKAVAAQPETAISPPVESAHEWPASQPSVSQPPAAAAAPAGPAPSAVPAGNSGASASMPTAAAPQNVAKPQPPKAQTPKQQASVSTAARQAPTAPAPIHTPAPAAGRGNEIKLF